MKKIFGFLLALLLALIFPASAEVDFDPAQYSEEELREIQRLVRDALLPFDSFTGEETVLYEGNGITVLTTGWEFDADYAELSLDLIVLNESGKAIAVTVDDACLNGWVVYIGGWMEVPAGRRAKDDCYCYTDEDAGVTSAEQLETLEFALQFCDPASYEILFSSDVITLYF